MIEYKLIEKNNFKEIEKLRKDVFSYNMKEDSFYYRELIDGKMVAIGVFLDDNLIAGAYISDSLNSLYIEQLFVNNNYQKSGIGTNLIKYIHEHKNIFEEYFKTKFDFSKLEPNSKEIVDYYKKLGYIETNDFQESMNKKL